MRKPRDLQLVQIAARADGLGVTVKLDLPPHPGNTAAYVGWEVRQLQRDPTFGQLSIECGGHPPMYVGPDGEVRVSRDDDDAAPTVVNFRLSGPEDGPYHSEQGFKVRLLLDRYYPVTPPLVHFMQTVHHFFLDSENGLPAIFYDLLGEVAMGSSVPGSSGGGGGVFSGSSFVIDQPTYSLRATLRLIHHLLQSPLHPCEGCEEQFKMYGEMHRERDATLAAYLPIAAHPPFFADSWRDEWLDPQLRSALASGETEPLRSLMRECAPGIFAFPMLTHEACALLIGEVDAYADSSLPASRPNSMNKYGLVLNEVGMEPLFDSLQSRVLAPIASLLFPLEGGSLDRHHSFVVQYEEGKDLGLDMHTDNSDVTFNICLGREFEGAGLTFCGDMGHSGHRHFTYRHEHVVGHAVAHLGRRRHGADDIAGGERLNLIVWNTNLAFRASDAYVELQRQHRYDREAGPPDPVCLSYTHDRDYLDYMPKPAQHSKMVRRAWCPPEHARHRPPADAGGAGAAPTGSDGDGASAEVGLAELEEARDLMAKIVEEEDAAEQSLRRRRPRRDRGPGRRAAATGVATPGPAADVAPG